MNKNLGAILCSTIMALSAVFTAGSAHADDLVVNGDFTTGIPNAPGWTIFGNVFHRGQSGVDFWFGAGSTAQNGPGIIAFNAGQSAPNGTISQTFNTLAGATYTVEYDFGATENATQQITASVLASNGTTLLATQVASDTNNAFLSNELTPFTFLFVADGIQATLRFSDFALNATANVDGVLDNVSVLGPSPIPEPSALVLLAVGLAGLAFGRRKGAV